MVTDATLERSTAVPADNWRCVDWPAVVRRLDVADRSVQLVELGEGPTPAVLLHGTGACWQHWLESLPHLARNRRVIAPDLPGFGGSELPAARVTVDGYAAWLDQLCDALGLDEIDLVGHSMGGLVAAHAAVLSPSRIRRVVLVGGTATGILAIARSPLRGLLRDPGLAGAIAAEILTGVQPSAKRLRRAVAARPRLRALALWYVVYQPRRLQADVALELVNGAGRPGFVPAVLAHRVHARRAILQPILQPTLAIAGEYDRLVPSRELDELHLRVPRLQTLLVKDAGHLPMIERPAIVNEAIERFLDADDLSTGAAGLRPSGDRDGTASCSGRDHPRPAAADTNAHADG